LKIARLPPVPQIPTKTGVTCDKLDPSTVSGLKDQHSLPQLPETSFTKAKRKRASRDITNHDDSDDNCDRNLDVYESSLQPTMAPDDPFTHSRQHSEHTRKAARTSTLSTPGQRFIERLESRTVSLPTPTPGRFNDRTNLNPDEESDLTMTVLELIRSDNPKLKAFTELQLRHKIGTKLDVGETKLWRYEETISALRNRLDEMETTVLHLTA
jgi:hypothetical protein